MGRVIMKVDPSPVLLRTVKYVVHLSVDDLKELPDPAAHPSTIAEMPMSCLSIFSLLMAVDSENGSLASHRAQ
jgi:hypothetical protein